MADVWQYLLLGLGLAPAYVLAAQGLVVTYRGSGAVNFANGAFAMLGAWIYQLTTSHGTPAVPGLALGVAAGAAAGAATYLLVMRRLTGAAQLTRVIATLGVAIVGQQALTLILRDGQRFPVALFSQQKVTIFGAAVSRYYLIVLGISVLLTLGLWALYRFTAFGLQTSAVAENRRAAAALGRSPELVGTLNWTLGAALAALGGILIVPVIGLSVVTLPLLLVPSLAAGLLGSFTSFWLTLLGGIVIGVGESELTRFDIGPGWSTAFPFLLILAVLLFRSSSLPERGVTQARLPAIGLGTIRPALVLPVTLAACAVTLLLTGDGPAAVATSAATATVLLSSVVVTGYAGQVSLAQLGLAGVGAYIAARLAQTQGLSFWLALPLGVLGTLPIGALVGLPALRTRGVNLAIVTLGLGLIIQEVLLGNAAYTGGLMGTVVTPPSLFGLSLDAGLHPQRYAILTLVVLALCAVLVANLRRGRVGRRLIAVRANERAAAALGIDPMRTKLYAFVVSAGIAAVGGVLLAYQTTNVIFSGFNVTTSISLLGFVVVGGIGFIGGSLVGGLAAAAGIFAWALGSFVHGDTVSAWIALAGGVGVVATIVTQPDGVAGDLARRAQRWPLLRGRTRERAPLQPAAAERAPDCLLEVDGVRVRFGGVTALDGVSLDVRSGEVVGLIGPNGAGKTTMVDAISGITRGYEGSIRLDGAALDRRSATRRARAGIGRSFQALELFEDLSVEDNLRAGADMPRPSSYVTDLVRPGTRPLPAAAVAAVQELELEDCLERKPGELSHGKRRLVGIARAIAARPTVLLLDEPAAGLDDRESRELARVLRRLADEWNFAVLLIEHDMNLVMSVCDRIVALDFGRVIAAGAADAVRHDPAVVTAYLGDVAEPGLATPGEDCAGAAR